jgi:hypothetical protein
LRRRNLLTIIMAGLIAATALLTQTAAHAAADSLSKETCNYMNDWGTGLELQANGIGHTSTVTGKAYPAEVFCGWAINGVGTDVEIQDGSGNCLSANTGQLYDNHYTVSVQAAAACKANDGYAYDHWTVLVEGSTGTDDLVAFSSDYNNLGCIYLDTGEAILTPCSTASHDQFQQFDWLPVY